MLDTFSNDGYGRLLSKFVVCGSAERSSLYDVLDGRHCVEAFTVRTSYASIF